MQSLFFLNLIFQASSHLLWLYSQVCQTGLETPKTSLLVKRHNLLCIKLILQTIVPYHCVSSPKTNYSVLNSNHSYFLLVDNGTVGKYGGEIIFRKRLEKYIAHQKICISKYRATVKFLNFGTPENFDVIFLRFKQRGQNLGYFVKKMQMK